MTRQRRRRDVSAELETFGGAMPKGAGDLSLETRGIAPIPETARYGSVGRVFTVWFAPNIVPAAFFLGTLAAASFIGLGWWSGLFAIVVGNVIGAGLTAWPAPMGPPSRTAPSPPPRPAPGKRPVVPGPPNWGMTTGGDGLTS